MRVCLSLGLKTVEEVIDCWERWSDRVDIVEIRLDTLAEQNLSPLLRRKPGKVIITNRRKEEGGFFPGDEESRVRLLMEAAEMGADYVDLEASTPQPYLKEAIRRIRSNGTRLILSYHDLKGTPSLTGLKVRFRRMKAQEPDLIKIVTMAHCYEDNLTVLALIPYAMRHHTDIISFAMGPLGKPSRVLAGYLGSHFTYVSPAGGQETAPGQLTFSELEAIRRMLS